MRKKILCAIVIIVPIVIVLISIAVINNRLSYSKCVGECENTKLVEYWRAKGEAYELGVNSRGQVIFKDAKLAFEQAKFDYKQGFDYLYQYKKLPVLSGSPSVCDKYFLYAMQANPPMTVKDYEIIKRKCKEIAGFLDIYLNSFKPVPIR